jgi:hypothetical protein
MDFSDPSLRTTYNVPAYKCDSRGFLAPESAEQRFQSNYNRDCASFFDPDEALRPVKPRRPVVKAPRPELIEAALAPLWTRTNFSCSDPRAFDKFESEVYPLPASVVRDSRPPLQQVGSQSRFDGREPVDVYRKLGHEQNFEPIPSYPGYY